VLSFDTLSGQPVRGKWQPCTFEFAKHVLYHECADEAALVAFAQETMNAPVRNKEHGPWWEMHMVTTRDAAGRSMIFFRVEHACGDGMAILQVLSRLGTTEDGQPLPEMSYMRPKPAPISWFRWLCGAVGAFFKYANLPLGPFDSTCAFHPTKPCELLRFAPRRLVVVPPHSLNMIKRLKNAVSDTCTVNDVVYAAFSGAVRRYCEARSGETAFGKGGASAAMVRALVPVAFPRSMTTPLTNDWTFVSTPLALGEASPTARVRATSALFGALKASPEALVARLLVALNATLPPCLFGYVGRSLMSRHSVVFSNVPGPPAPISVGGKPVLGLLPVFPNLITQVLCVSYRSQMYMTITADEQALPEPDRLSELYLDELRALALALGVDPQDTSEPPLRAAAAAAPPLAKSQPRELV